MVIVCWINRPSPIAHDPGTIPVITETITKNDKPGELGRVVNGIRMCQKAAVKACQQSAEHFHG